MSKKLINENENPGIMKKIILPLLLASLFLCIQSCSDSKSGGSSQAEDTEINLSLRYVDDYFNPKWPDVIIISDIFSRSGAFIFHEEKKVVSGQDFWKIYEGPYRLAAGDILKFTVTVDNKYFRTPEIPLRESDFYHSGGDDDHIRELGVSFTASYFTGRDEFDFRVYLYGNVERELTF